MKKTIQILISALLVIISVNLFAAKVAKVKGRKVIISLSGTDARRGDLFQVFNKKKKFTAFVKITKVKGKRAYGLRQGKGRIKKGYTLKLKKRKAKKASKSTEKMVAGILLGPASFTMSVSNGTTKTNLKGTSNIMVKGFFDYNVFDFLDARVGLGSMELEATNDSCVGTCEVFISYMVLDATARFVFNKESTFRPWVGPHFGIYIPGDKLVTAITEDSVSTTNFFGVGFGFDFLFGALEEFMIPVEIQYGIFPPSDEVSANLLMITAGFGYRF